jgi:hypothetical protein
MKKIATIKRSYSLPVLDLPRTELKLNLAENNTIDYGTITKGRDNGIRVFEFTNTGPHP